TAAHPERRAAQRALASAVCELVHGPEETRRAERASETLFGGGDIASLDERLLLEVFEDAPSSGLARDVFDANGAGGLNIVEALVGAGLCTSKSDARRLIDSGGIYVNDAPVETPDRVLGTEDLLAGSFVVLRRGRRDYHLLRVE
ncbi:MAG: S4 domain-containing protein, partial [Acidimicrobiales bacterium]